MKLPSALCSRLARIFLAALLLAAFGIAHAQTAARVVLVTGTLVETDAAGRTRVLAADSTIGQGSRLRTAAESFARLRFGDGSDLFLRPNTEFVVDAYRHDEQRPENDSFVGSLLKGGFRTITGLIGRRSPSKVEYKTQTSTIGIRGSHGGMTHCADDCAELQSESGRPAPNGLHIDVVEGIFVVRTQAGEREFGPGATGHVRDATSLPVDVPSGDAIYTRILERVFNSEATGGQTVGVPQCEKCTVR